MFPGIFSNGFTGRPDKNREPTMSSPFRDFTASLASTRHPPGSLRVHPREVIVGT